MADNKNIRDYRDRSKVNMNEPYEVSYWTKKWGITKVQLEDAVNAIGNGVKKIEVYLQDNGLI